MIAQACEVSVDAVKSANAHAKVRNETVQRESAARISKMKRTEIHKLVEEAEKRAERLIEEKETREEQKTRNVSQYQRIVIEKNMAELIESRTVGRLNGWEEWEAKKLMKRVVSVLMSTPIMRCGMQEISSKTGLNRTDAARLILGMRGAYVRRDGDIISIETEAIQRWK